MKIKNVKHIFWRSIERVVSEWSIKDYNLGLNLLQSMSGRSPKKGKGSGRPKKTKIKWWNIRWIFKWS
nr:hypothetical protein [Mycoplasmopsis bovis]